MGGQAEWMAVEACVQARDMASPARGAAAGGGDFPQGGLLLLAAPTVVVLRWCQTKAGSQGAAAPTSAERLGIEKGQRQRSVLVWEWPAGFYLWVPLEGDRAISAALIA